MYVASPCDTVRESEEACVMSCHVRHARQGGGLQIHRMLV